MNKEKNLKWHFVTEGGTDIGPNDSVRQNFKGNPYYYIVRESIQNSLDAVLDKNKPVEVSFDFVKISRLEYPSLFRIEEHIDQCRKYYADDKHAERLFEKMKNFLNKKSSGKKHVNISCLKISDFNTIGMDYKYGNQESPFYSFVRAQGKSSKRGSSSGGSFGFGKGAYFNLSAINTVLASTKTRDGEYFFEGITRLTTHRDSKGIKLSAFGQYNNGEIKNSETLPVSTKDEIPHDFIRKETGTDFLIIGRKEENLEKVPMIKSVLNNFWLAIYEGKLSVKIDNELINKDNLDYKIFEYYGEEESDNAGVNDFEKWNPKSYYKAVHYAGKTEKFCKFSKKLPIVGKVRYYVYRNEGLSNKTCFMRKPKMVVYKETNNKLNGYSGVFICDDSKGDEILMEMENPAHNQWNSSNYLDLEDEKHPAGIQAKKEINGFIKDCLEDLAAEDIGSSTTVLGLNEYLNIPEDLIGDEDEDGYSLNRSSGQESNELSKDETGSLTSIKTDHKIKTVRNKPEKEVKKNEDTELNEEGENYVTVGVDKDGERKKKVPHSNDGDQISKGTEGNNHSNRMINISYRVVAQKVSGKVNHTLLINSPTRVTGVQLDLIVGNDQGDNTKGDNSNILFSDNGKAEDSSVKEVNLEEGMNKIRIQFEDNLKHSIGVKAYEVR
ncbi:MAG: hypothetical protein JJ892_09750 [Balneola sp.]|nr:hypothetical protein [Balneola sp.]MBO6649793.1 hypothetical protein [Balneola sp.]MBO6712356.1 hypothetical protein [Balneola sp.]MBO6800550.1 hypothetical protein [Balneola sp.]MBO6871504.1 hypothetical protein [Balneola sp.]